jgi:hypothetical protein
MEAKRTSMGENPAIYCVKCKTYSKHIEENTKVECVGCGLVYYKVNQWVAKEPHEQWPATIEFDDPGEWRTIPPSFSASSMVIPPHRREPEARATSVLLGGSPVLSFKEFEEDDG